MATLTRRQKDKITQASAVAETALATFQTAHTTLTSAVDLLTEAKAEHEAAATAHKLRANEAQILIDKHTKAAAKIQEFLA